MVNWLIQDWRLVLHAPWREVFLVFASIGCGAIIGSERQKHEKPAGMRTIILVTLGATVFTMASFLFTSTTGDSGRVAAQIVTGIGFLGAGVIMRGRGTISGTTTAATIWVAAAIGIIVGAGHVGAGLGLSILVLSVLTGVAALESRDLARIRPVPIVIDFDPDHGKARVRLERILIDFNVPRSSMEWSRPTDGADTRRLTLQLRLHAHHVCDMLDDMVADPSVKSVDGIPEAIEN